MGCCHSCCPQDDEDDDEYSPLLEGPEYGHAGFMAVLHTDDVQGRHGGRPRAVVRPRSASFSEFAHATDYDCGAETVRAWSYGGSRGVHSVGSSSGTLTGGISAAFSTDIMTEEEVVRVFFGPCEDVSAYDSSS